jgi:hypothetical protein
MAFGIRALSPAECLDLYSKPVVISGRHHETLHRKMGGVGDDARTPQY